MIDQIQSMDANILLWIQEHLRADWLNPIMKGITHLGDSGIFWIILCLALLIIPKTRRRGLLCTLSLILEVLIVNVAIKPTVARIRPYEAMDGLICLVGKQKDFSFPSGHSMRSFAAATVLFMNNKKFGIPAFILAFLTAFSRVYLYAHYFTDVFAGAILGIVCAIIVYKVLINNKKVNNFLGDKFSFIWN